MKLKALLNAVSVITKNGVGELSKFNPVKNRTKGMSEMKIDWATITIAICLTAWLITYYVLLPMFNIYLQYKKEMAELAMYNEPPREFFKEVKNEERLQRDNDFPDIKQRSGKSDDRTSIHDEELPL
jgi:hypothetical protein